MRDLLTTKQLLEAAKLTKSQLRKRRQLYPDLIQPSQTISDIWLWDAQLVKVLLQIKVSMGRPKKNRPQGE